MPVNDPTEGPTVRAPRPRVLCNGQEITSAISFEINNNNHLQADTFEVEFALNKDPNFKLAWWDRQEHPLLLDVQASIDDGQSFQSLILGQVDHMTTCVEGGLITVDGRDLSAWLIDARSQPLVSFNKTASQIIEDLASRYGLAADVTPTRTLVGRYYRSETTQAVGTIGHARTAWDLCGVLAQAEQYDSYVTDRTLHFHPRADAASAQTYAVVWDQTNQSSNTLGITVDRSLKHDSQIAVEVRSWDSARGRAVTATAGPVGSKNANVYSYIFANLMQSAANDRAQKIREQLMAFGKTLEFIRPADNTLTPRTLVSLQGTGSPWDTIYQVDRITRRISLMDGYTMSVHAKTFTDV